MSRKERHVVPNNDGGWDSKRENAGRASKLQKEKMGKDSYYINTDLFNLLSNVNLPRS